MTMPCHWMEDRGFAVVLRPGLVTHTRELSARPEAVLMLNPAYGELMQAHLANVGAGKGP